MSEADASGRADARCPLCDRDHLAGADPADEAASSPCIMVCVLNADGVCLGCHRDAREIAGWAAMTPDARQAAMHRVEERRDPPSDGAEEPAPGA